MLRLVVVLLAAIAASAASGLSIDATFCDRLHGGGPVDAGPCRDGGGGDPGCMADLCVRDCQRDKCRRCAGGGTLDYQSDGSRSYLSGCKRTKECHTALELRLDRKRSRFARYN